MIDLGKITTYEQEKSGTCGPAALRILLSYFGIYKTEAELAKLCAADEHGTRPENLKLALEKLEFQTQVGWGDTPDKSWATLNHWVNGKKLPVIVNWFTTTEPNWDGHYSVVLDLTKEYIILADPEFSEPERRLRKLAWSNFLKLWLDWPGDYLQKPEDINLRWWLAAYK
jgi:ABC-type bacteriocin/lantibiotic exporter with double-glycine peptidase domain